MAEVEAGAGRRLGLSYIKSASSTFAIIVHFKNGNDISGWNGKAQQQQQALSLDVAWNRGAHYDERDAGREATRIMHARSFLA